jgi:hypothetical protein
LRALYTRIQADMAADVDVPIVLCSAAVGASPTLDGQILGRLAQLDRQRRLAHLAAGITGDSDDDSDNGSDDKGSGADAGSD